MNINLNLLAVLDALVLEKNVTRAGRRLGLSQPAVSHALSQLRQVFGDPLFVRASHGVVPTERALTLGVSVRQALALLEASIGAGSFDPRTTQRSFVIATTDYVEFVLLPKLLARLGKEAPGIRLRLRSWPYHRVSPGLETGEEDLMLGFYPRVPSGHRDQALFKDRFVCIVRADHPTVGKRLTLKKYLSLSHVLVSQTDHEPGVVDGVLAKRGLSRHVALRLSHFLMVPPVIASTDMVAAVDYRVASAMARVLPIRMLPPPLPLPGGGVGQVWHERTHLSAAHTWLRRVIVETSASL